MSTYLGKTIPVGSAPFGLPYISPSGMPINTCISEDGKCATVEIGETTVHLTVGDDGNWERGATPSVVRDRDDSNDAELALGDTGQIDIYTETNKGDQE